MKNYFQTLKKLEVRNISLIKIINIFIYIDGKTTGEGIRKIPSYKCSLQYDKVNNMRERFWKSRKQNKNIWNVLRECCEAEDNETAELILNAGMMACVDDNIRQTFFISNPGYVFRVPNFCIADPVYEKNYENIIKKSQNILENKIIIVLSYMLEKNKTKNIKIETSNKSSVKEIKNIFIKKIENKEKNISLRFFYEGQELIDDYLLCYNNIKNMGKIQVVICHDNKEDRNSNK